MNSGKPTYCLGTVSSKFFDNEDFRIRIGEVAYIPIGVTRKYKDGLWYEGNRRMGRDIPDVRLSVGDVMYVDSCGEGRNAYESAHAMPSWDKRRHFMVEALERGRVVKDNSFFSKPVYLLSSFSVKMLEGFPCDVTFRRVCKEDVPEGLESRVGHQGLANFLGVKYDRSSCRLHSGDVAYLVRTENGKLYGKGLPKGTKLVCYRVSVK